MPYDMPAVQTIIGMILFLAVITVICLNCTVFADYEEEKPSKSVKIHIYKC